MGKTTLLNMIAGITAPDKGRIAVHGSVAMIAQLDTADDAETDRRVAARLGVGGDVYSGGEKTKQRVAQAFSSPADILLADEPTTNLDMAGIRCVEDMLLSFRGGLMLVSHDRALLKKVCNKVLDIDRGVCMLYHCGYDDYIVQKEIEATEKHARYDKYITERNRLKKAAVQKAQQSARVRRAPRRMGNSEARLHKMGDQKAKYKLDSASKAAKTRLRQLEKAEKPWEKKDIVFDVQSRNIHSPVLVNVSDVTKSYGSRSVFAHCSFTVPNHTKTALIGANGSGKTTLLNMIAHRADGIETCANLKIGYYRQDAAGLDGNKSVLENAMDGAVYDQCFVRTVLARLRFWRAEVDKPTGVISGGERIKLAIAKIILSGFNLLLMDEPTNYLDIASRYALEEVLCAYPGALLFVSHDREFIARVADRIIYMDNNTTKTFEGGYDAFAASR